EVGDGVDGAGGYDGQLSALVHSERRVDGEAVGRGVVLGTRAHGSGSVIRGGAGSLPGRGHSRRTTRPTTTATPKARLSSVTSGLSPSTQWPPGTARRTRFTTSNSGRVGKRARTTSPGRTVPGERTRRARSRSPDRTVGTIDGPVTLASAQA